MQESKFHPPLEFFDLASGRSFGHSTLSPNRWPLASMVTTAWRASSGHDFDSFREVFVRQWSIFQGVLERTSAAEYLGLSDPSQTQRSIPHWGSVTPWDTKTLREMQSWLPGRVRKNRRANGLEVPWFLTGRRLMRFDALKGGESHAAQYFRLLISLNTKGFSTTLNGADPLLVIRLRRGSETRWLVWSGTHRTVSAATLGFEGIFAQVRQDVDLDDVAAWPNVLNGCFSPNQATSFFNDLFEGRELPYNRELLDALRSFESDLEAE